MANCITLFRFVLLFPLVWLAYRGAPGWQLFNAPLLIFIIALDGLDGYVARKRGESSNFGSVFDIAIDRVVELVLWVVLAHLGLVPLWVAIVFLVRGTTVDALRFAAAGEGHQTAFGMMRSPLGRFLVAGRFMRGFYGTVKAVTFAWLFFFQPWSALWPDLWAQVSGIVQPVGHGLVLASVALCIIRGVPAIWESLVAFGFALDFRQWRETTRSAFK